MSRESVLEEEYVGGRRSVWEAEKDGRGCGGRVCREEDFIEGGAMCHEEDV